MTKKIIYLSLKDLKELGVIKRKRSKRKKYINVKNNVPGVRSTSDHMIGYTQYGTPFTNTSNLANEIMNQQNRALMLKNDESENQIKSNNLTTNNMNNLSTKLQRDINNLQTNYYYIYGKMAQNEANEEKGYLLDDNIDVPASTGGDSFKSDGSSHGLKQPAKVEVVNLTQPKAGAQTVNETNFEEEEEEGVKPDKKEKIIQDREKLREALLEYGIVTQSINQQEMRTQLKNAQKIITTLIGEYKSLGGERKRIITSKNVSTIEKAIDKIKSKL